MLPPRTTTLRLPLHRALVLLSVVAALLAATEALLAARAVPDHALLIASYPVVGAGFVVVGAVALARRPSNQTGALLAVTGALILAAALADDAVPEPVNGLALLLGEAPIAATLHVVLAFPSGRVRERFDQALVLGLYALVLVRQAPVALPGPDLEPLRDTCSYAGAAVIVVAVVRVALRVRRRRRGTGERRVLVAVYGYGMGLLLFFPFSARVLRPLLDLDVLTLTAMQIAGFAGLPPVFAAGILLGGFARTGELDELATVLGGQVHDAASLRDLLAQVLGDPSLQVSYADPGDGPGVVPVRAADGRDTGVWLSYDPTLFPDAGLVEQAGRVVAVALERERLRAELVDEQAALRASRTRVVEVGDRQRRELAQDLHDLLQSRLTLTALHVGRLAAASTDPATRDGLVELGGQLDVLITEFRRVVHGVMPALLVERGLPAAAEDLVDRLPVAARLRVVGADDLPPVVATHAYFILAEALTNAVRHSGAGSVHVEAVRRGDALHLVVADDGAGGATPTGGAGLRGVADRVESLGGTLALTSPVGAGTRLEAVLPCAW